MNVHRYRLHSFPNTYLVASLPMFYPLLYLSPNKAILKTLRLCLYLCSCLYPNYLSAQVYEGKRLVVPQFWVSSTNFTQPFYVAVYFKIAPEWHLYWKNAGDSGIPPTLQLQVPPQFVVGDVLFPTPHRIETEGSINYTYDEELLLLLPITPQPGADTLASLQLTLYAEWLTCRDKCLRGRDTLHFDSRQLSPSDQSAMQRRISQHLRDMPKPLSELGVQVKTMQWKQKRQQSYIQLQLSKPLPAGAISFFPENIAGYTIAYGNIAVHKRRYIHIPLSPETDDAPPPTAVKGLLMFKEKGYEVP